MIKLRFGSDTLLRHPVIFTEGQKEPKFNLNLAFEVQRI